MHPALYTEDMRYLLPVAGFSVCGVLLAADVRLVEEIVCKVNGDIITRSELERDRKQLEGELVKQGLSGSRLEDALGNSAKNGLRERIDQLLLIQKAKELNLNADTEVNKQVAEIQRRSGLADPEKFREFVREQTGRAYEDYVGELRNGLMTQRVVREEVGRKIQFRREELQAYYEEHKNEYQREERVFLREILVSADDKNPTAAAAAEKKAKDLVARARRGERFPEMAQTNSDANSAQNGGYLDPYPKGALRADLENTVWDQAKGYVTDPIKIPNGFLILKVDDHQKAGLASFEEIEAEIQEKLFAPRMDPAVRAYLTKLREMAFLEIKAGFEDSGAAPGKDTTWTDPAQLKPETVTKEEVLEKGRRKHLLWLVPIPGTRSANGGTSSSR